MIVIERERERVDLAERLTQQLANRKDIHARQLPDGRYHLVKFPFSARLMYLHLRGEITLGTYLLDQKDNAKFMVLDADDSIDGLKRIHTEMNDQDAPSYLEASRRGGHLWFFFKDKTPGEKARGFGMALAKMYHLDLEVYPKQEYLSGGPGSLIRVPLGIHRKTGQRYEFIGLGSLRQQAEALCDPLTVSSDIVEAYQYHEKPKEHHTPVVVQSIPLATYISRYVELRPTASGFIGLCPFHDDAVPSFGINIEGNYWNCFAGCGGGDLVSFVMKLKNISFLEAVKELEKWKQS